MYLTAEQLGITSEEHAGLIKLMEHFASPRVLFVPTRKPSDMVAWFNIEAATNTRLGFNMNVPTGRNDEIESNYSCGCAACIGGHLSLLLQGVDVTNVDTIEITLDQSAIADLYVGAADTPSHPLYYLFYPHSVSNWNYITPGIAAKGIRNFLTKHDPHWDELIESE